MKEIIPAQAGHSSEHRLLRGLVEILKGDDALLRKKKNEPQGEEKEEKKEKKEEKKELKEHREDDPSHVALKKAKERQEKAEKRTMGLKLMFDNTELQKDALRKQAKETQAKKSHLEDGDDAANAVKDVFTALQAPDGKTQPEPVPLERAARVSAVGQTAEAHAEVGKELEQKEKVVAPESPDQQGVGKNQAKRVA